MRGKRPHFSPSTSHRSAISLSNRRENRVYDEAFSDAISERVGTQVFVYTVQGKYIDSFTSIIRAKKAYLITLHHKTFYKFVDKGLPMNGYIFTFKRTDTV